MTKRVIACLALLVGALAQIALALPDLVAAGLEISPVTPTDGVLVTISATVENTGHGDADDPFFIRFSVDNREIDVVPLASLDSGRTKKLTTTWTAAAGPHVLSVEIDAPFDRVEETDEQNNSCSLYVKVRLDDEAMAVLAPLRIAVARFDDLSGTRFVNVGEGVADELIDRFSASGLMVLERSNLDTVMQEHELNPAIPDDVAAAGQLIGADLLILGSVTKVNVHQASQSLGFLRIDSASADIGLSAQVVDVHTSQILSLASAEGHSEGTTGFSIVLGQLLSFLGAGSSDVCEGGLQADRAWYNSGRTVLLGYRNEGVPKWFGVEIHSSTGAFLKWLGWQFVGTGECERWFWDQRNASGLPMNSGIYAAKLWDGTSYIDTVGFQIRPGVSLSIPPTDEITVGSRQFDETVVGEALSQGIDRLTSTLLLSLEDLAPLVLRGGDREAPLAAAAVLPAPREGQIAAILPDGRIAINLGTSSGVTEGDVFEVLEAENLVFSPQTNEILAYDAVSVRGELVITEAREQVSYAVPTTDFVPIIGDIVRSVP